MHDLSLIATIAAAFTAAWVLGLCTQWLGMSPIVGYLLAGIVIGPFTPGFAGDVHVAAQLAEVGVILLMFGVGLHFDLRDLVAVRGIAVPGAVGQSLCATVVAVVVFSYFGMPVETGMVLGMAMAVASTVVLMRVLMDADVLDTPQGHAAVGWLIVEDIFTVVLLVLIPVLGGGGGGEVPQAGGFWGALGLALLKLGVLAGVVLWGGARVVPWVLVRVARLRSRELFTLTVLVFSVAVAAASYFFFGASMALGAFLAGMVVAQSPVSHQAAADALPMRDTFAVIFFVSVGMLFDPRFLLEEPLMVMAALGVVLVAKPLAALVIVAVLGYSVRTALTVAVGLAQVGEFSFILSDLARRHGLMPDAGHNVLVAAAILSIALNPVLFRLLPRMEAWLRERPVWWRLLNGRAEKRVLGLRGGREAHGDGGGNLAVVVGYGPVGRSVHQVLRDSGVPTVVVDLNMDTVAALQAAGHAAIFGDASNAGILEQAGVAGASHVVVTLPDGAQRAAVVAAARGLGVGARILVRARYLRERDELERGGVNGAVFEEAEAAVALARMVLAGTGMQREATERRLRDIRLQLLMDNITNIRTQRVASVMVPWELVQSISLGDGHREVLAQVSRQRYSRWPVVEVGGRKVAGYLLAKDLISYVDGDRWPELVRPLGTVHPDDTIEVVLARMQDEGASLYLVEMDGVMHGMITFEDLVEQVVGHFDDEVVRGAPISLGDAVVRGGLIPRLASVTRDGVIRELTAAVPARLLPVGYDRGRIRTLVEEREAEVSTDLGNGIALPHARVPGLAAPLVVVGRSAEGVAFSGDGNGGVRLFFLILTALERPDLQLTLLGQLARMARQPAFWDGMMGARSAAEVGEVLDRCAAAARQVGKR